MRASSGWTPPRGRPLRHSSIRRARPSSPRSHSCSARWKARRNGPPGTRSSPPCGVSPRTWATPATPSGPRPRQPSSPRGLRRPAPAARHVWTASLAAATSVFGVRASAAQTTATVDVGVSTVRYDGFLASAAGSLTPALTWERPGAVVTARGTYLHFESGRRSLQGLIAASLFTPPSLLPHRWRGQLSLSAGGSDYADFASFWHATGEARLHYGRSEERRVGKECRSRGAADHDIKKSRRHSSSY